jgi:glycosyltransferase involved in cell wall biosynthesis
LLANNGIKTVFTVNNIYKKDSDNGENVENKYIRRILQCTNTVIVFTNKTKVDLLNELDLPENKVKVVSHGNYNIFRNNPELDKESARKIIGLKIEKKVLLFFGNVESYKGLMYLIKALNIIKDKETHIYLLIVGKFNNGIDIKNLIREYDLEPFIMINSNFVSLRDVEKFFIASDIVVMPYVICTHSGIHHMAYSFGRPVIATTCGELTETIEDGKSGFLVPPGNEYALADSILRYFMLSEKEQSEMSKYCLKIAEEKYSWQPITRKLMEVYDNCLSN